MYLITFVNWGLGQFPRTIRPTQFPLPFWVGQFPQTIPPNILCIHTYTCMHTYTYIHTHIHIHTYIHTYIYIHIHTYVYMHTYTSIHIHTYTSIHIHSFRPFLKRPLKFSTTQRRSRLQHRYCIGVSRRSAQATGGKGLAQGPYMAAKAGVEPTTLRLKAIDSTKVPPCPMSHIHLYVCMRVYYVCTYVYIYV